MSQSLSVEQLLADWIVKELSKSAGLRTLLSITRAEPRFATRNYLARYKVRTAALDGTGQNPTDIGCSVVEVSFTNQRAELAPDTACDSIKDL
jgi:hypothetical protein